MMEEACHDALRHLVSDSYPNLIEAILDLDTICNITHSSGEMS